MGRRDRLILTWTGYAAFVIIGWGTVLLPNTLRSVERSYAVDDAQLGLYFLVATLCSAGGALLYAHLARRLRLRVTILWCLALLGVTWLLQAASGQWVLFFLFGSLGSLVNSASDAAVNSAVLQATPAAQAGRTLNRLHLMFGVGCIVGAAAIGRLLLSGAGWQALFIGTAVLTLLVVVLLEAAKRSYGDTPDARPTPPSGEHETFKHAIRASRHTALAFWLLAWATGLYVGLEIALTNWLPTFYSSIDVEAASVVLGAFWAGLTLGRLLLGQVADRLSLNALMIAASLLGLGFALISLAVASPWLGVALVGLSGFWYGPIYPLLMVMGARVFTEHIGAMSGGLTAAATVGGALIPALLGVMSNSGHLEAGLAVAAALLLPVAACIGGLALSERRTTARTRAPV